MGIRGYFQRVLCFALVFIILIFGSYLVGAVDIMTFEANIFHVQDEPEPVVGISVPDYLFMGNLTKGEKSNEMKVYVNNTGDVPITVIPQLINNNEKIFSYLYFRETKTHNGLPVPFERIGDFSFNVTSRSSSKYFYVTLDLTDYPYDIPNDMIGHKADVKFVAFAQ